MVSFIKKSESTYRKLNRLFNITLIGSIALIGSMLISAPALAALWVHHYCGNELAIGGIDGQY